MASDASILFEWKWIFEMSLNLFYKSGVSLVGKFEDLEHDVADLVITVFLRDGGRMLLVYSSFRPCCSCRNLNHKPQNHKQSKFDDRGMSTHITITMQKQKRRKDLLKEVMLLG